MRIRNTSITISLILAGLFAHTALAVQTLTQTAAQAISHTPKKSQKSTPILQATSQAPESITGKIVFQAGGFSAHQGKKQNIIIQDTFSDELSVTKHHGEDFLLGLGIFANKPYETDINHHLPIVSTMYGVNMFYFPKTIVKGNISSESFNNSTYRYTVANFPIYLAGKTIFKSRNDSYNFTFDLGVGPNVIRADYFSQEPADGGASLPDNPFSGHTKITVSATTGVGLQFNNVIESMPVECGYRFFYLGRGHFTTANEQISSTLYTGNSYANAFLCSVTY